MNNYGVPMPQGVPMPSGAPGAAGMLAPGAATTPAPYGPAPPAASPVASVPPSGAFQGPSSLPPNLQPRAIGQNGFGIHPDVTVDELVDHLLPKFRDVESSGDYKAKNPAPNATASGAYGYTNDRWGNYKGYPRAMDAPPEIQDEKMRQDLLNSLQRFGNDPYKAVANHYYPAHARDPTKWDTPIPGKYGKPTNAMTVNQYVQKIFPSERVARYLQGVNPSRSSGNNQASLQLP